MHSTGHSLYRRIIATFLFLLFGVIYSGKAIHTHEQHPACSHETGITTASVSIVCTICEFQLSKDLEVPVVIEEVKSYYTIIDEFVSPSTIVFSSLRTQLKDRAPPVLS